jgi:hypothetical protein
MSFASRKSGYNELNSSLIITLIVGIIHANCSSTSCVEMDSTCLYVKSMQFMAKDSPNLNKEHVEGLGEESYKESQMRTNN